MTILKFSYIIPANAFIPEMEALEKFFIGKDLYYRVLGKRIYA